MNAKDLLNKGFNITVGKIKFGTESKSEKPKIICPKCQSKIVMFNSLTKEWSCKCGQYWTEK